MPPKPGQKSKKTSSAEIDPPDLNVTSIGSVYSIQEVKTEDNPLVSPRDNLSKLLLDLSALWSRMDYWSCGIPKVHRICLIKFYEILWFNIQHSQAAPTRLWHVVARL